MISHNQQVPPTESGFKQANESPLIAAASLREMCLQAGADDVGFVSITRPELEDQRDEMKLLLPGVQTVISLVLRMNRGPLRSPLRSVANAEFHHSGDKSNAVASQIVRQLEDRGLEALNPPVGFPMEMSRFPSKKIWTVSHKPIAVAAGLGQMGIHRNVIHPRFGNFILLSSILLKAQVTEQAQPIDYNPCMSCKLCVAACPVGAIHPDGAFDFSACFTHNYREFMGGFKDWVSTVSESRSRREYSEKMSDAETASMWQSLSFGANYKAAYCLAVCPAGEEVISPFQNNRAQFLNDYLKPLQDKAEDLYVVKGSDAATHAAKRFPHKTLRFINSGLDADSVAGFLFGARLRFQRKWAQSQKIERVFHFTFTGREPGMATIQIQGKNLNIDEGQHLGKSDVHIIADSEAWVQFLRKERHLLTLLAQRKLRFRGDIRAMQDFKACFLG